MGKILKGYINLSKIPKNLITTTKKGEKCINISISELRQPSTFGDTHTISTWGSSEGRVFIGNLKETELNSNGSVNPDTPRVSLSNNAPTPVVTAQKPDEGTEDLPF